MASEYYIGECGSKDEQELNMLAVGGEKKARV